MLVDMLLVFHFLHLQENHTQVNQYSIFLSVKCGVTDQNGTKHKKLRGKYRQENIHDKTAMTRYGSIYRTAVKNNRTAITGQQ